jgi:protein ImuB
MAASDAATAAGIRRGMTLTQARALCAEVAHADYQPDRDRQALEALGRWMMRFSPVVALGLAAEDEDLLPVARTSRSCKSLGPGGTPVPQRTDALFLDVTGCDRVFGGFDHLVRQVSESLARLGLRARVAAAPTPGAAWALALNGKDGAIIEEHQLEPALDPLPIEALRVGDDACAALHHLGLHAIGQVMYLPREVLPARFGPLLLRRIDQAMGWIAEPLVPLEYRTPVEARLDWDGAVGSLEAVWSAFQNLIGQIIEQLARRGQGARRVEFELLRLHSPAVKKAIFLSRPSRDPVNLFNLFRCAIEDLQLPVRERSRLRGRRRVPNAGCRTPNGGQLSPQSSAPGTSRREVIKDSQVCDEGFSGMRISIPLCERLTDEQIALLAHEQYAGQVELDRLLERLRVRIGNESVLQPEAVETYVPESAWTRRDAGTWGHGDAGKEKGRRSVTPGTFSASPCPRAPASSSPRRPLHLLPTPAELRVMVTPSEDAEGHPAAFTHEGTVRPVAHCVGPERIAGRWWDGHDKTRDYFDVADATGRRFWIFRVGETGRWYLHGMFE